MLSKNNLFKVGLTVVIFLILSFGTVINPEQNDISFVAGIYVGKLIFAGVLVFGGSSLIEKLSSSKLK
jgi:hypothetical protein